jgi:integrase
MLVVELALSFVITVAAGFGVGMALDVQSPSALFQAEPQLAERHADHGGFRYAERLGGAGDDFLILGSESDFKVFDHCQTFSLRKVTHNGVQKGPNVPRRGILCDTRPEFSGKQELESNQNAQHTLGHVDCPACKGITLAIESAAERRQIAFPDAVRDYLDQRSARLGPKTLKLYGKYAEALMNFFGEFRLSEIEIGHVVAYQRERQAQIRSSKQHAYAKSKLGESIELATDGASIINHEISCVLQQVLKRAGLWTPIGKFYEPLPLPKGGPGIALSAEEERHLFQVAQSRPRWLVAYCCSLLSRNTTAGPGEIRHLRVRSVDLRARAIAIEEGVKNDYRIRTLPLNDAAYTVADMLLCRYRELMSANGIPESGDHYLLPHRADRRGDRPDPYRPIGSWKKAFYSLRAEAGKKYPRIATLRRYDFRHTACTLMLEDATVPYAAIERLMGHRLGSKTKARYNHIRDGSLRAAVDAINTSTVAVQTSAAVPVRKPIRGAVATSTTAFLYLGGRG